jgi:hypothetical protein
MREECCSAMPTSCACSAPFALWRSFAREDAAASFLIKRERFSAHSATLMCASLSADVFALSSVCRDDTLSCIAALCAAASAMWLSCCSCKLRNAFSLDVTAARSSACSAALCSAHTS